MASFSTFMIMSFAANLKQYRTEKNISQEELAGKIGVHPNHLSRYERGLASPSIDVVQKISEVLDISIDQLVYGKEQNIDSAINDREMVLLFKKVQYLSAKQKEMIKEFLSSFVLKTELKEKLG